MNKQINIALWFLSLGIFHSLVASIWCFFILDDINCYTFLEAICNVWDKGIDSIIHKAYSMLFYRIGMWGFIGSILWYLEEKYLSGFIKSIIKTTDNIFGTGIAFIVSFLIMNYLGTLLGLHQLFELLYSLVH